MDENSATPRGNGNTQEKLASAGNGRARFPGISYRAYEHPLALAALVAMRKAKGFDAVLAAMNRTVAEPILRMQFLASAVRVGPRQFGSLHAIKREAVEILDLDDSPELYVCNMTESNAFTMGMSRPFIVVSSGLLDLMDEGELRFVIGHELGHVLSGHALYHSMAHILANSAEFFGAIPFVGLAHKGVDAGLREWQRKSELSCDRAGLLVAQDTGAATRALMKLAAGSRASDMDAGEFLEQAAEFQFDITGVRNRIYKLLLPRQTHPILTLRALELDQWVRCGDYARIAEEGEYHLRGDDDKTTGRSTIKDVREKVKAAQAQRNADREQRRIQAPG